MRRISSVGGVLSVVFVSFASSALSVSFYPSLPKEGDIVVIMVSEECGTGHSRTAKLRSEENNVYIDLEEITCPCDMLCAQICVPIRLYFPIDSLLPGTHEVHVAYRLLDGCTREVQLLVTETVKLLVSPRNSAPVASFSFAPSEPKTGQRVYFEASSSHDTDGEVVAYVWYFDDEKRIGSVTEEYVFREAGIHTVRLEVADDEGNVGTFSQSLHITPNIPPSASFAVISPQSCVGCPIYFDSSPSQDSDGFINWYGWDWETDGCVDLCVFRTGQKENSVYAWDFGCDGLIEKYTANPNTVFARFPKAGTYPVTLRVRDNCGAEALTTQEIRVYVVNILPVAKFQGEVISYDEEGVTVRLNAIESYDPDGAITSYRWDWNSDGTVDLEVQTPEVVQKFGGFGPFLITLVLLDNGGGMSGITKAFSFQEEPTELPYIAGEVLVKFHDWVQEEEIASFIEEYGLRMLGKIEELGVFRFRLPEQLDVWEAVELLGKDPRVKYVEPNYMLRI